MQPRQFVLSCNYDVSNTTAATRHIKLQYTSPINGQTLVVGLNRHSNIVVPHHTRRSIIDSASDSKAADARKRASSTASEPDLAGGVSSDYPVFSLAYIKYDFYPPPVSSLRVLGLLN